MFYAVALVVSLVISGVSSEDSSLIERSFQPMTECNPLDGNALDECIKIMQERGMAQCRDYLKNTGRKEGIDGEKRNDCVFISLD